MASRLRSVETTGGLSQVLNRAESLRAFMSTTQPHRLIKAIQEKKPATGMYSGSAPPNVELLGYCGLDYVILDMEHTAIDLPTVEKLVASASLTGISLLVRVPRNDLNMAQRALDIGANGLVFPHVNTKQEAIAAVSAAKYSPVGRRGYNRSRRAIFEGKDGQTYTKESNENVVLMPLVEEIEGVRNIDEILSVEGIDAIDIGMGDLSYSLGTPSKYRSAELLETLKKAYDACAKKKKPFCIDFPLYSEEIGRYLNRGFSILIQVSDEEHFITKGLKEQLAAIKSLTEHTN
jgi:2-keto-3-deoxy-L-rhamnonate aldolase RhmA